MLVLRVGFLSPVVLELSAQPEASVWAAGGGGETGLGELGGSTVRPDPEHRYLV